jgi:predicted acylesterase/phospholipase RssA
LIFLIFTPSGYIIEIFFWLIGLGLTELLLEKLDLYYKRDLLYIIFGSFIGVWLVTTLFSLIFDFLKIPNYLNSLFFVPFLSFIGGFIGWWVLTSIIDPFTQKKKPIALEINRFDKLRSSSPYRQLNISFTLSGGGYRAALMHSGVIAAAEHFGLCITHISSVSGGAIIGAFYAAGGSPEEFHKVVKNGSLDLKRGLFRIQNILKLLLRRSNAQANLLNKIFFNEMALNQIPTKNSPEIIICTTDLLSGGEFGLTTSFVIIRAPLEIWEKQNFQNILPLPRSEQAGCYEYLNNFTKSNQISTLVTASGAFPLAFDAIPLKLEVLNLEEPPGYQEITHKCLLADGGITDNSGLDLLLEAHRFSKNGHQSTTKKWNINYIVASDASALFELGDNFNAVSGFGRAVSIIHKNVGSRASESIFDKPAIHLLNPELHLKDFDLEFGFKEDRPVGIQKLLPNADIQTLEFLTSHLPEEQLLYTYDYLGLHSSRKIEGDLFHPKESAQSLLRKAQDPAISESDKEYILTSVKLIILDDFKQCLVAFRGTSTLSANFEPDHIDKLYRLGIYLFAIDWNDIKTELDELLSAYEYALSTWEKLLKCSKIKLTDLEQEKFKPDLEIYLLPPKVTPVPPQNMLEKSLDLYYGRTSHHKPQYYKNTTTKWSKSSFKDEVLLMHAACLAHRLGHILYQRGRLSVNPKSNDSLVDEFRSKILPFENIDEVIVDGLTIELLKNANINTSGIKLLAKKMENKLGINNLNDELESRIKEIEDYIENVNVENNNYVKAVLQRCI